MFDYNRRAIEGVFVSATSGKETVTDSAGKFSLLVPLKDSIWFSYFGKNTQKYPVDTISNPSEFEIALHIDVPWLPEVRVRSRSYSLDSIANRNEFANIFNYRKPGLRLSQNPPSAYIPGSVTVGLDLDELIKMFQFKKNRQTLNFQQRLLQQEQDNYINHRFSPLFIKQITHLQKPALDTFIMYYKPTYETLLMMNDLELGYYIEQCYKQFQSIKTSPAN
ncbi:MAG: hypothetical protein ACR2FN_01855 [Chitinophagaceae bacterium]